ncbi:MULTISPECIES: GAP family protein [Prauserella salsuginis group]|uniref:GAP family protein n=1 Tax=Prauserella salsuginis TaxID=387889 RepID=A0ABW6G3E9_9PSEU|nr:MULTISPECIES: GAP family protein [Prauserella salsuginis group]MCR3718601.1 Sap, sulfolipid-1-addressing protein [Prauserella flava]MCR3733171.1 Sap, sulfolipid-1-addressing protein [Prauserella salsuginis]
MPDTMSLGTLVVLALVDSMSFGTLLIPVWLLMTPGRVRVGRVLLFLLAVTATYFLIGLALLVGAIALIDTFNGLRETDAFLIGQLAVGLGLFVASIRMDNKGARARAAERAANGEGRISRWRAKAMGDGTVKVGSAAALMALAVTAVVVEVATMIPYLAAIGIITTQGPGWPGDAALLAGYCFVMIIPALVLTFGRIVAHSALAGPLSRLDHWLTKHAHSTTAWIIGIVGAILALRAVSALEWIG